MKKAIGIVCGFFMLILYISSGSCKKNLVNECADKISIASVTKTAAIIGRSDGTMTIVAAGGSDIKYSINDTSFQASGVFTKLAGRDYTVTAKNASGCTDRQKVTIDSIPDPCLSITVVIATTKTDANSGKADGSITATATAAGTTDFTYQVNGGAFQTSGTFTGLAAGVYVITAKTSIGCTGSTQITIGTIDPCAGVTVAVSGTPVNPVNGASNGSITVTATGGTGFTFSLNGGAFQSSGAFSNLAPGAYTVTAKSAAGCTGVLTFTLVNTVSCVGVTITVTGTSINPSAGQANGSITATVTGGTGITYSLNGGAYQASGTFTNLVANNYTVTAKNTNGCTGTRQFVLIDNCTTYAITLTPTITGVVLCASPAANGIIALAASGGVSSYTYSINGSAYSSTSSASGLATGTYPIAVKDAAGCIKSSSAVVGTQAAGPLFTAVKTLVTSTACSNCHSGQSSPYFGNDCNIVSNWDKIQLRMSNGTGSPGPMPPSGVLTAELPKINAWVNAGHTYIK